MIKSEEQKEEEKKKKKANKKKKKLKAAEIEPEVKKTQVEEDTSTVPEQNTEDNKKVDNTSVNNNNQDEDKKDDNLIKDITMEQIKQEPPPEIASKEEPKTEAVLQTNPKPEETPQEEEEELKPPAFYERRRSGARRPYMTASRYATRYVVKPKTTTDSKTLTDAERAEPTVKSEEKKEDVKPLPDKNPDTSAAAPERTDRDKNKDSTSSVDKEKTDAIKMLIQNELNKPAVEAQNSQLVEKNVPAAVDTYNKDLSESIKHDLKIQENELVKEEKKVATNKLHEVVQTESILFSDRVEDLVKNIELTKQIANDFSVSFHITKSYRNKLEHLNTNLKWRKKDEKKLKTNYLISYLPNKPMKIQIVL